MKQRNKKPKKSFLILKISSIAIRKKINKLVFKAAPGEEKFNVNNNMGTNPIFKVPLHEGSLSAIGMRIRNSGKKA
jgi:hypothetical protein